MRRLGRLAYAREPLSDALESMKPTQKPTGLWETGGLMTAGWPTAVALVMLSAQCTACGNLLRSA